MRQTGTPIKRPEYAVLLILILLLYLPFVNKAFHIDDVAFINISKMFGWNPLQANPSDYPYCGNIIKGLLPYEITHPLLIPWFIKLSSHLFGEHELSLHLCFIFFPIIALLSMFQLNRALFRESSGALGSMIFLASIPAFAVNAGNIMTDVPTLAFLLLAILLFVRASDSASAYTWYLASLSLTFSVFSSYQSLLFVPIIFVYLIVKRKISAHALASLMLPCMALLAWLLAVYASYDIFPVLKNRFATSAVSISNEISRGWNPQTFVLKLIYIFAFFGSSSIFLLTSMALLKNRIINLLLLLFPLTFVVHLAIIQMTRYTLGDNLLLSFLISTGVTSLGYAVSLAVDRMRTSANGSREIFLLIWLASSAASTLILPFGAMRYLLPALPPLILIFVNDSSWNFHTFRNRVIISTAVILSLLWGMASAYSDYRLAGAYRSFADETRSLRTALGSSVTIWYIGEWGMRYYMEKAGARYLQGSSNDPKPGDFVIAPSMPLLWYPSTALRNRLEIVKQKDAISGFPLKLFNEPAHAGFYGHYWGLLPFSFSSLPDVTFSVFRVVK